jgi:hypothetical protein
MINFSQRVEALQVARAKKHRELDGSTTAIRPEVMVDWRNEVEKKYQDGLVALANEYSAAEASLNAEVSAARHKVWLASVGGPDNISRALPTLTGAQLAEVYKNAIAAQDQAVQFAVEFFQPNLSADDRTASAALREIDTLKAQQQAARSQTEQQALAAAEAKLKALQTEYSAATGPLIEERARAQYRDCDRSL